MYFSPIALQTALTDKERPLVMLEGLCLSSPSEHPSQSETNVSIALTSAVMAFLPSGRKTRTDHKNICSSTEEVERWYSEQGNGDARLGGVQKNS